jgi:predicted PurR-regulated permease PerM
MPQKENPVAKTLSSDLMDVMIRFGLIVILVVVSVRIFEPFLGLVLWALILAVVLYPLQQNLARRLSGRQGRAATLIVLAGVLLIGIPSAMLAGSFASFVHDAHAALQTGTLGIDPPKPGVAEWPLIGEKAFEIWDLAARDLPALLEQMQPQLGSVSKFLLGMVASTAGAVLMFVGSLIIAGIMMAYGTAGGEALLRIVNRLAGADKGAELQKLSTATIRSVALGVIGIAFIQALLLGVGFIWAGVPAAGLLAAVVLLLGILQLPALLVSLPVIGYVWWSGDSTAMNTVYTVYLLVAGMADNVLKPIMLGRGVEAPMPIILLGALGGMVTAGMIGLFVGAVFLTLGYVIFMAWVDDQKPVAEADPAPSAD